MEQIKMFRFNRMDSPEKTEAYINDWLKKSGCVVSKLSTAYHYGELWITLIVKK